MLTAFGARNARLVVSVALISLVAGGASRAQLPITELARVTPSDSSPAQGFGNCVAVSGGLAIAGAYSHGTDGAAYVYRRGANGSWLEDAKLEPPDPGDFKCFGYSVAISGPTAVIGAIGDDTLGDASGAAYVFERGPHGAWSATKKLLASNGAAADGFGFSVSIDRDTLAVGAAGHAGVGEVYVFERNAGGPQNWGEVARLSLAGGMPDDLFGWSLSLDGDSLAVGAPGVVLSPVRLGRVAEFRRSAGTWSQTAEIVTPAGVIDHFGYSVALSGDSMAVSAPYGVQIVGLIQPGRAWVLQRNPSSGLWIVGAELHESNPWFENEFGSSVALDEDTAIVGAMFDGDFGPALGSVHVFSRNHGGANAWGWVKELHASAPMPYDEFGASVDLADGIACIGAPNGAQSSNVPKWGSACIITLDISSTWSSYCTSGISLAGCTPRMSATGRPSASANTPFTVRVDAAEGQRFGAIVYGAQGPMTAPWGTGGTSRLCIQLPVQRTNIQSSGGTALACDGSLNLDWNAFVAAHPTAQGTPFAAGETLWFQGWLRDIGAPKNSMLSDALAVTLMP